MAHNCPECDCICHCGGDIDDLVFERNAHCSHCDDVEDEDNEGGDFIGIDDED